MQQYIFRFYITMDNLFLIENLKSLNNMLKKNNSFKLFCYYKEEKITSLSRLSFFLFM